MEKTSTTTGLQVFVSINDKIYETGKKVNQSFKEDMKIVFDDYLPQWNYTAVPENKKVSNFYHFAFMRDKNQETKKILQRTMQILEQNFPDFFKQDKLQGLNLLSCREV